MLRLGRSRSLLIAQLAAFAFLGAAVIETAAQENLGTVVGTVRAEATQNPLVGATVRLVGTDLGSLTGQNGTFVIEQIPPGRYQVEVSFLSYSTFTQEITVAAGQRASFNAELVLDPLMLDEIVVTGYGSARKEELTGSMISIPAEKLTLLPSTTFQDVIQGNPGVLVTSRDGAPGAGINIRVRGIGSITAGSEPLYVIDGIPLYNDPGNLTEVDNGGRTANPLASLNPNDIESLVVLKDAAATAIYGSRGANGVVLITTKGGVAGNQIWSSAPKLELRMQTGISGMAFNNLLEGLNAEEYHDYFISSRIADGMSQADAEEQYVAQWPVREDNNWRDLITRNGISNQFDLSAIGGSGIFTYYLSAGVFDQEGNVLEQYFKRFSSRANITAQVTDRFTLANNLSVSKTQQNGINDGSAWEAPFYMAVFMPPVVPLYDEEGNWYAKHTNVMGANHPLGGLYENPRERETTRLIENLTGTFRVNDRISLASAWSFDIYNVDDYVFNNARFGDGRNNGGAIDESTLDNLTWQGTQTLNFNTAFRDRHNVDAVVGYEASTSQRDRVNITGTGFAHPELKRGASAAITTGFSDRSTYSFSSVFTQMNYDYDRKYFLSGSYRRDGSSRFGPDRRYGDFWSVGLGWTLTNESFMDGIGMFDYLKLRGSYGEIGNADIGNYDWQGLYGFARDYDGAPGSSPSQVANRLLTWESQNAFNVGFDYAMFDSKLTGSIEYYKKDSKDLLLDVPVSYTTGFTSTLQNFGDMKNSGIEFSLHADLLRSRDFDFGLDFNVTSQNNEITRLTEPFIDGTKRREEGRDYQEYFLLGWAGVDPANGKPLYYTDETKTETTSSLSQAERFYDGKSATPDYMGSFGFTSRYKRFTLSTLATYMMGHYLYEGAERFYHGDGRYLPRSTSRWSWENSWKKPGDIALVPQQKWGGNSGSQPSDSDRWLDKGDFIRFRNLTLAYEFSEDFASRLRFGSLRAHVNVNNAFTWVAAENLHFDPEQTVSGVYNTGTPNSRTLSFGFTVGF